MSIRMYPTKWCNVNLYKVGMHIGLPQRASFLEALWYLIQFRSVPTDTIYEIVSIDEAKIGLKFLYRI